MTTPNVSVDVRLTGFIRHEATFVANDLERSSTSVYGNFSFVLQPHAHLLPFSRKPITHRPLLYCAKDVCSKAFDAAFIA